MNGPAGKTDLPSVLSVRLPTGIGRGKPERRFWAKIDKNGPNDCWLWRAAKGGGGYGCFRRGGRKDGNIPAHRFIYELLVGPIPKGLTIDHLCRNRLCVNPAHLEAVTHQVNILRGEGLAARNAKATHCIHGHPFDLFNTRFNRGGKRDCRACD